MHQFDFCYNKQKQNTLSYVVYCSLLDRQEAFVNFLNERTVNNSNLTCVYISVWVTSVCLLCRLAHVSDRCDRCCWRCHSVILGIVSVSSFNNEEIFSSLTFRNWFSKGNRKAIHIKWDDLSKEIPRLHAFMMARGRKGITITKVIIIILY